MIFLMFLFVLCAVTLLALSIYIIFKIKLDRESERENISRSNLVETERLKSLKDKYEKR
jgi:hypothetical protein